LFGAIMAAQKIQSGDPNLWQCQQLRLTAFTTSLELDVKQSWWNHLFGSTAENINYDKKQFLHQETGVLDENPFSLRMQPGRIDWNYVARHEPSELMEGIPTLGFFPNVLGNFSPLMLKWLENCPEVKRLAFGTVLLQPTADHVSAYETLGKYLRSVEVDPNATDFNFQINRRRISKVGIPNLAINRLTRWSALRMEVHIRTGTGSELAPANRYAARLDLDINTAQEFKGALPSDRHSALYRELVELGREITVSGEIP
jgi:hypothetical protein